MCGPSVSLVLPKKQEGTHSREPLRMWNSVRRCSDRSRRQGAHCRGEPSFIFSSIHFEVRIVRRATGGRGQRVPRSASRTYFTLKVRVLSHTFWWIGRHLSLRRLVCFSRAGSHIHEKGQHRQDFFFFASHLPPHVTCPEFYREIGFSIRCPSSTVRSKFVYTRRMDLKIV